MNVTSVSLMMSTWFLATAFSELLAHKLATLASVEDASAVVDHSAAWTKAANKYGDLFWNLTIGGLVCNAAFASVHQSFSVKMVE